MHERYIIAGSTPRSGTYYFTQILKACGLDAGHERVGSDATVGHLCFSPDSRQYKEALGRVDGRDIAHIHLLRHPIKTIESIVAYYGNGVWPDKPLHRDDPCLSTLHRFDKEDSLLLRAMKMWHYLHKNFLVSGWTIVRVEEIKESWWWVSELLGLHCPFPCLEDKDKNSARESHIIYPKYTIDDLKKENINLASGIVLGARLWGYRV